MPKPLPPAPKVLISIVGWNSKPYLWHCLTSVFQQTFRDFFVVFVDNASLDGSSDFVHKHFSAVAVLKNTHNTGFSRGHNQAILVQPATYVLVMNPDVILTERFLERLVAYADDHPRGGSFGGMLRQFHFRPEELNPIDYSGRLDSVGLAGYRSRRVIDRGHGQEDRGQFDHPEAVFGISGALALYRTQALADVRIRNEFFDETFFLYKEDVDLAWRLRLRQWESFFVPAATAYHHREARQTRSATYRAIVKNRQKKRQFINAYSYKNHLHLLVKNEFVRNIVKNFPFIFLYELRKFLYILFLEPKTLRSLLAFWKEFPGMLEKRKMIMRHRTAPPEALNQWFR